MKYLLFFVLMFAFGSYKSQSHRFVYELKYVSDSTKTDSISTEIMRLDIFKDHSEFLSDLTAKRDSSLFVPKKESNVIGTTLIGGNVRMRVYKGKENYSIEDIGTDRFKIDFDKNQNWTLENESKIINNYKCQKATLKLNGRDWIAWFTTDIPIQNGPYIFTNLPGLIVFAQDSEKHFEFNLIGNFKVAKSSTNFSFTNKSSIPKTTRDKFSKKWRDFRNHPVGFREQWVISNPNITNAMYYDESGNLLETAKVYKEDREKIIIELQKNNNYFDKDLRK